MHPGNTTKDTTGCILVGRSATQDTVTSSRKAFGEVMDYATQVMAEDKAAGQKTTITVKISDPAEPQETQQGGAEGIPIVDAAAPVREGADGAQPPSNHGETVQPM